jgi:hypothetical protein
LGLELPDSTAFAAAPTKNYFVPEKPTGPGDCPLTTVEARVYGTGCSWTPGAAETSATEALTPCDGSAVRCLNGTVSNRYVCQGVAPWDTPAQAAWCDDNCNHFPSYCPESHCDCVGGDDCYGIPFYDSSCAPNSDAWFQKGQDIETRGCDWVAENPRDRCDVSNADNVFAWEACMQACYCCDVSDPCSPSGAR